MSSHLHYRQNSAPVYNLNIEYNLNVLVKFKKILFMPFSCALI